MDSFVLGDSSFKTMLIFSLKFCDFKVDSSFKTRSILGLFIKIYASVFSDEIGTVVMIFGEKIG